MKRLSIRTSQKAFLQQVKNLCKNKSKRFVAVPPGDNKTHDNVPSHLQTGPRIEYKQEDNRTCLTFGFASALHYLGATQAASEISRSSKKIIEKINTFSLFTSYVFERYQGGLNYKNLDVRTWNIYANGKDDLVVVLLKGDDGKEDHCVTLSWSMDI